jgi:protein transport protein SEC61 subunit gamma-like protein
MDIVESSWKAQKWLENKAKNVGSGRYGRVLKMARKPTNDEYVKVLQITSIGIILVGLLGFTIYYIFTQAPGFFSGLFG